MAQENTRLRSSVAALHEELAQLRQLRQAEAAPGPLSLLSLLQSAGFPRACPDDGAVKAEFPPLS